MAYNGLIPQATDLISASQPQILANFTAIETFVTVNHVGFASADQGKHKFVTFPVQAVTPATVAGDVALFSKASALTGKNELFFQDGSGNPLNIVPFTASDPAVTGWAYLPSGILMKWGTLAGNGSSVFAFPVAANIPVFTAVYSCQVTTSFNSAADVDVFVRLSTFSTTAITVYCSSRTTVANANASFNYLVIGV